MPNADGRHAAARRLGIGVLGTVLAVAGLALALIVARTPLRPADQAIFGTATVFALVIADRFAGRGMTLVLVGLSLCVTLRYAVWRVSDTLAFATPVETALGVGLVLAEAYAIALLMLGYLRVARPLESKPRPLPTDPSVWPTVDAFILARDEPIDQVKTAVLASLALDWPPDAIRVWLLDDGPRDELRLFAEAVACGYVTRDDHRDGNAGSLNHALAVTDGAFVCVFDGDHIPTRAFLQLTMGWLVAEPTLAFVQTPICGPNQAGDDTWDATLFRGSCAVLRRAAIDDIGGFAVVNAAWAARTMLKLRRRGWRSASLAIPLASGLATGPRSAGHAMFVLPRLAFLSAPLAFLLAGQTVIAAPPLAIAAYALPHIVHAFATNARLRRGWRHVVRSEVDGTAMAMAQVRVTLATLVTGRGTIGGRAAWLDLVLALLLVSGIGRGVAGALAANHDTPRAQAFALYLAWAAMSLLLVLAAFAAGRRPRRTPTSARLPAVVPVRIRVPDGRIVEGVARELWNGGAAIVAARPEALSENADLLVEIVVGPESLPLPAQAIAWNASGLDLRWRPETLDDEARIVRAVFGRADAWAGRRSARALVHVVIAAALLLGAAGASAQTRAGLSGPSRTTVRIPGEDAPDAPSVATSSPEPDGSPPVGSRRVTYSLRQLGADGPIALRGASETAGVAIGIRADEVVTGAQFDLVGALSPNLIPNLSTITVTLNEHYVGTVQATRDRSEFALRLPIDPVFFQDWNRLDFRFAGRTTSECDDPLSGLLWATVYDASTLTLTLARAPPRRELARLPLPFLDPHETDSLTLPVILPANPGDDTLRAAAIVASWFGAGASSRGATFPVVAEAPVEGNAALVAVGDDAATIAGLPPFTGPTLAVVANPNDAASSILVVGGRNAAEAVTAATALSVGEPRLLGGARATVAAVPVPERRPYDAPAWIATNRAVRLGELVDASALQSVGYVGLLRVPFRTAPDLYTGPDDGFPLRVKFHAPPGPIVDLGPSRLDLAIDGQYLGSTSLAASTARVAIPAGDLSGADALQFYFDARPLRRGDCGAIPGDLRMSIDPESTIDLSGGVRFAELPNLAWFVSAGFPFTRMADLSETAVVLSDHPSRGEIGAFLDLMGRMGALTGSPVIRVAVVRPGEVATVAGRDLLMLGTLGGLAAADPLLRDGPVRLADNRLTITEPSGLASARRVFDDRYSADRTRAAATLSSGLTEDTAAIVGAESPLTPHRSVVAMLAAGPEALARAVALLRDNRAAAPIQGDLSLVSDAGVASFRVRPPYTVGALPFWVVPGFALRDEPLALLPVTALAALLLGSAGWLALRGRARDRLHR